MAICAKCKQTVYDVEENEKVICQRCVKSILDRLSLDEVADIVDRCMKAIDNGKKHGNKIRGMKYKTKSQGL